MKTPLLAALATLLGASSAASSTTLLVGQAPLTPDTGSVAVHCGALIDGTSDSARRDVTVTIRNGRVESLQDGRHAAGDLPFLELGAYTCLPGLIDMHTHLTDRPIDTADLKVFYTRSREKQLTISEENAAVTLAAGFTTVRNVGTYIGWTDRDLRDAINQGKAIGPRMQVVGYYLTIPGGGGDLVIPGIPEKDIPPGVRMGVAHDAAEFRAKAQLAIDGGADLLKVIASGAVLAYGGVPAAPEMTPEDIAGVAAVAHAAGRKLAAHAHG
ncbi:MAG TPA: amidohydrolase family protein, partial [Steroidobacteraceae bacterium]